jgi:hypothetical protein
VTFGYWGQFTAEAAPPPSQPTGTVTAEFKAVTFAGTCPCGRDAQWTQVLSASVLPEHFTIACACQSEGTNCDE